MIGRVLPLETRNLCDTVFVHWCTSWKNGTENLGLGADTLIVHEFRPPFAYAREKHIEANATDTSLQRYLDVFFNLENMN